MMKTMLLFIAVFCLFTSSGHANPFACRIPREKPVQKEISVINSLEIKGFAIIGQQYYAIVKIGDSSFEVITGDRIQGYTFISVNHSGVNYSLKNRQFHLPLDIL